MSILKKTRKIIVFKNDLSTYKEYNFSYRFLLVSGLGFLLSVTLLIALIANFVFSETRDLKMMKLKERNDFLWGQLSEVQNQFRLYSEKINEIIQKDDQLRLAMNLPPITDDVRSVGIGGTEIVKDLGDYANLFSSKEYMSVKSVLERVNKLGNEISLESKSYEELLFTFKKKEDSIRYIPCVKPVPNHPITSRFGRRLHPILKVIKMHEGVDIMANVGTPIYAPADGVVIYAGVAGGYGRYVRIDHLKGFETRYGHMSKILVKIGQKVKRGDKIGEVGNSGISTGPHLHYEVLYNKERVNPEGFMIN